MIMRVVRETGYSFEYVYSLPVYRFFAMHECILRLNADDDRRILDAFASVVASVFGEGSEYRENLINMAGVVFDPYEEAGDENRTREEREARKGRRALKQALGG